MRNVSFRNRKRPVVSLLRKSSSSGQTRTLPGVSAVSLRSASGDSGPRGGGWGPLEAISRSLLLICHSAVLY